MPASTATIVFSSRFHRAARDGLQEVVAEASSRESNQKDKDGLTPTLWAAFCGHIDVLRVLISRGGDPNRHDRTGNTGLHLAAAGGHLQCVAFLVSWGTDIWALNVDLRTPRDLASACPEGEAAVRHLDAAMARETALDPKKTKAKKERARAKAEKLIAEYRKYTEKTKRDEEDELRNILEHSQSVFSSGEGDQNSLHNGIPPRRHSETSLASSTATGATGNSAATSGSMWSAIRLQAQMRGRRASNNSRASSTAQSAISSFSVGTQSRPRTYQFRVGSVTSDGSRVARQLPGIAPSTEVLYVNGVSNIVGGRRHSAVSNGSSYPLESVTDAFDLEQQTVDLGSVLGDTLVVLPPGDADEAATEDSQVSIFRRPGFGNVAFRHSLTGMEEVPKVAMSVNDQPGKPMTSNWSFKKPESDAVDGAPPEETDEDKDAENLDYDDEEERSPLQAFLVAWGLPHLTPSLSTLYKGDLEALMEATEEDLQQAGVPMGPRKKLLRAIELRNEALNSPEEEDIETKL